VLGFGIGGLGVSQNLLVSENVPLDVRPKALSGLHSIYGLASLLAPILAAQATLLFLNWQATFISASGLCFLLVVVNYFNSRRLRHIKAQPVAEAGNLRPASWVAKYMIAGLFSFYVVAEILVSTRLALYMRENFGMDLNASSLYVTYFFIFLFIGRLIFAMIKIPGSVRLQMNLSLLLSLIVLVLGLWVHPFFLAIVGLMMAPYYPLSVAYISQRTGQSERSYLTFAMAMQSLSVVGMHVGAGYMTDSFGGVRAAFAIGVAALFLSAVCLNFHPKKL
jgi:MFS transporter, FHS family, glucose/mannose:H+ symporter